MAQTVIATNRDAKIILTLKVRPYSDVTFKALADLGFSIAYQVPELELVIGEILATRYMAIKDELLKLAIPTPPVPIDLY